jgi:hypothetical protein
MAAHGGEAFIEGYSDGTPASPRFSTPSDKHPTMLDGKYRTAFIAAGQGLTYIFHVTTRRKDKYAKVAKVSVARHDEASHLRAD